MSNATITITITPEVHDALLTAADMANDVIGMLDLSKTPYAGEALGDVRDLLLAIARGDLSALSE